MPFADVASASHIPINQLSGLQIGNWLFSSTVLSFNMQHQTQSNWCWAATSTSVSHYYFFRSTWTQCKVAGAELGRTDCCNATVPSACNVPWFLDRALTRTSNLDHMVSSTVNFSQIEAEVNAGRVIGARIGWSGGGGHFVCIYGFSRVGRAEYVDIDDPIYGKSHITLATFTSSYQGNGSWTHTYFTKRWPVLIFKLPELAARAINLINEQRPLLAIKRGERDFAVKQQTTLAVPHDVYVIGLNDVLNRDDPLPEKPVSTRVFEVEAGRNRAVYELSPSQQGEPQLNSMSDDAATMDLLEKGLSEAQAVAERAGGEPELRFVRIPALYVEAYWLRYPDKSRDMVVPIRGIGLFTPHQPIPVHDFIAKVREAARERQRGSTDDAIAP